ncbi:hypothetical protein Tco_0099822 [Tanacetum coccineum]
MLEKTLVEMGIRDELAPQVTNGTKMFLRAACYALSKAEKTIFCECLHGVKVPYGYSANIRKLVSMKDLKLVVIDPEKLDEWQRDIPTLCQLEMYFPPSFFDVMVHLVYNIVGYASEEVVQFCTNYMDDVSDIGLPQPRHEGRLDGMRTIGRNDVTPNNDDLEQAHLVLQNMICIEPYIPEHMSYLAQNNTQRDVGS